MQTTPFATNELDLPLAEPTLNRTQQGSRGSRAPPWALPEVTPQPEALVDHQPLWVKMFHSLLVNARSLDSISVPFVSCVFLLWEKSYDMYRWDAIFYPLRLAKIHKLDNILARLGKQALAHIADENVKCYKLCGATLSMGAFIFCFLTLGFTLKIYL